jgi:hypothetical protein
MQDNRFAAVIASEFPLQNVSGVERCGERGSVFEINAYFRPIGSVLKKLEGTDGTTGSFLASDHDCASRRPDCSGAYHTHRV